jgi:hypothetical protein
LGRHCTANPTGNAKSHRGNLSFFFLWKHLFIFFLSLPLASATPFGASVHYARASLFEGLSAARAARLEELLDNRFRPSSWRKIRRGLAIWRDVAREEGWSAIISTDDFLRGSKLVTYALQMADETDLTYKSIETYLWGMRTWQTLQGQADPALGVMGWDAFMTALKVITWAVSEPRRQTPIWVIEAILDSLDVDDFEDVQFANLMLSLAYTFSRAECPLPKSHTGEESFDTGKHWRVCDFDARTVARRICMAIRFQALKQDPRVERPEAAGNNDWAYIGSIPDSKWCPLMWAKRLQAFHGHREDKDSPYFVSPWDRSKAYLYGAALSKFHRLQKAVGVPDEELTSFHGLRVCGYNRTKRSLGEDLAVAHGMWKSTAHTRYDRFEMSSVVRIPAAIAGLDSGDALDPFEDGEREAGSSRVPVVRRSAAQAAGPSEPEGFNNVVDEASGDDDEPQPSVVRAPPGWMEETRVRTSGRRYSVFVGPGNTRRYSMASAWRAHEEMASPSPRAPASLASDSEEERGAIVGEASAVGADVVDTPGQSSSGVAGPAAPRASTSERLQSIYFPDDLHYAETYVLEQDRPSTRKAPFPRGGSASR